MKKGAEIKELHPVVPFQGDFEEVYTEHFQPLFIYARKLTNSAELAKDIVSDVFYNLWKSNPDFSQIKEIKSYLFIAVKNHAIRILTRNPQDFISLDQDQFIKKVDRTDPEEVLLEKELLQAIEIAVSKLPDQCQLIFDMAKNQQMSYQEIGKELGISQSTIKTQVGRALNEIRVSIADHLEAGSHHHKSIKSGIVSSLIIALLFA
ncbi:MAG: RNA polymerase sigma-70 factor [Cyclobacteriaceae bacterium]